MTAPRLACVADHEQLSYHGHSDCLNAHAESGPYHWIIYTWPCAECGRRFAWMLAAEQVDTHGDWSGQTVKGAVFAMPEVDPVTARRPSGFSESAAHTVLPPVRNNLRRASLTPRPVTLAEERAAARTVADRVPREHVREVLDMLGLLDVAS